MKRPWIVEENVNGEWRIYADTARRKTEREANQLRDFLARTWPSDAYRVRNVRRKRKAEDDEVMR